MSLLVTGTIGIDSVQTPDGSERKGVLGGSGAYFAAAASYYGPCRLVAVVGDDFPEEFHALLKSFENVDTAGLEVRKGSETFRWGARYLEDMDRRETLFTDLGVLAEAPPAVPEQFRDTPYVFLANGHPATQASFLDGVESPKLVVVDTMDLWINTAKPELDALLRRVDGLLLNNDEAELLTGVRNPVTAGKKLLECGPGFVVIKKGEHGSILVHREGICALPAYPTEYVVDPTGAGDSFAGGMMGYLAGAGVENPKSFGAIRDAMGHGTIIASFNVETFSLERLVKLTRAEIDDRYAMFAVMMNLDH